MHTVEKHPSAPNPTGPLRNLRLVDPLNKAVPSFWHASLLTNRSRRGRPGISLKHMALLRLTDEHAGHRGGAGLIGNER